MFNLVKKGNLEYYEIESFKKTNLVKHVFTTKRGGVSEGIYESMNLRLNCDDKRENVLKNFEIIASAIGVETKNMVLSNQVHEANVVRVGSKDRGNGLYFPNKFKSADAIITNEPNVALVTFYADCVPIYFLDKEKKAIGIAHSGWKGTVLNIAGKTVEKMKDGFSTNPADLLIAIGPSIRDCHFKVGDEVFDIFKNAFGKDYLKMRNGEKFVDLQGIITAELLDAGVCLENITDSKICTYCNSENLFSHRKTMGKRGSLSAILELEK